LVDPAKFAGRKDFLFTLRIHSSLIKFGIFNKNFWWCNKINLKKGKFFKEIYIFITKPWWCVIGLFIGRLHIFCLFPNPFHFVVRSPLHPPCTIQIRSVINKTFIFIRGSLSL
jgi:hypothetical protein